MIYWIIYPIGGVFKPRQKKYGAGQECPAYLCLRLICISRRNSTYISMVCNKGRVIPSEPVVLWLLQFERSEKSFYGSDSRFLVAIAPRNNKRNILGITGGMTSLRDNNAHLDNQATRVRKLA